MHKVSPHSQYFIISYYSRFIFIKSYQNNDITVHFEASRCIHGTECREGLPQVFDVNKRP
ncbi:(4Fe-4S)-binding protein [Macrococcus epidermidis]|uniref:(4Fe-4S)-binding protein n=1 Tax=Macrococcus epidermidis TaxID=1902580 RepID=UPI00220368DA|nr:(4Fe-4S)-binding protein [Macrococcus epidermidis]